MKRLIAILLVVAVFACSFSTVASAKQTEKKIVIDGNLDLWYGNVEYLNYFPELSGYYLYNTTTHAEQEDIETHANIWTAFDETYIYVFIKVWDEDLQDWDKELFPTPQYNSAVADSIGVFIDPDPHFIATDDLTNSVYYWTAMPEVGDCQFRVRGINGAIDDYHDISKPNMVDAEGNPTTVAQYLHDPSNLRYFTFKDDEIILPDGFTTLSSGYGIEFRYPRHDDDLESFGLNVACFNGQKTPEQENTYALALGPAWFIYFSTMAKNYYDDPDNVFFEQDVSDKKVIYHDSAANAAGQAVVDGIDALSLPVQQEQKAAVEQLVKDAAALDELQFGYVEENNLSKLLAVAKALGVDTSALPDGSNSKPEPPKPQVKLGDVDSDGNVNSADALMVLKAAVKKVTLTETQFAAADIDKNGSTNSADALEILKYAVKKPSLIPTEQ